MNLVKITYVHRGDCVMYMHNSIVKTHQLDVQCVRRTIQSESVRRECLDEQTTDTAVSRLKSPTER